MKMEQRYRAFKFERAAATYHQASIFQRAMARRLMELLPGDCNPAVCLELGCGTGNLSTLLGNKYKGCFFYYSDIAASMLKNCRGQLAEIKSNSACFVQMDALKPAIKKVDLIASNAVVQWFVNLEKHFQDLASSLNSNGYLLISSLGEDNFPELRALLESAPFRLNNFPGHTLEYAVKSMEDAGLKIISAKKDSHKISYESFRHFLRILKDSGASGRNDYAMPPQLFKLLETRYNEKYFEGVSIAATWKPWYIMAKK